MLAQTSASIVPGRHARLGRLGRTLLMTSLVAGAALSCEKVPLTAPAGTVITLVSATNVLPINGSTEVVAVLIENGTTGSGTGGTGGTTSAGTPVHNGTLVTFTTSLGRIEPVEARTVNGKASVQLVADGRSGTAVITAFSGSASETLEVKIGAAAAERVSVVASPSSVPANGGTVTITARVEDESGNPLTGVPVVFSTTAGSLSAQSVLTNSGGFATTSLSTTVAAKVTATAGGATSSALDVTVRSPSTVELTVPAAAVSVGAATPFTIKPGPVRLTDVTIDFGDGESLRLGPISSSTVVQHFYKDDGIFTVEVSATDVDGGTAVAIGSVAVTPIAFVASASPTTTTVDANILFKVEGIPATVPIQKYVWDFGDGHVQTTTSSSISHSYQSVGTKTVSVTVHPLYGDPKVATLQVQINPKS